MKGAALRPYPLAAVNDGVSLDGNGLTQIPMAQRYYGLFTVMVEG